MRKLLAILITALVLAVPVMAKGGKFAGCTTIQDGTLLTSDGRVITPGYDEWGYNYQAHMFNGGYCDAYRDAAWCQPYKDIGLIMKWNDAWLSNKDCDGDGLLDRHYGFDSYIGSGAWLTNHQWGSYEDEETGKTCNWDYFVKIVAVPDNAYRLWNLEGDWSLQFDFNGKLYNHDMTITDQTDGVISGRGAYPAGGPYTITWTVVGSVERDQVEMTISYDGSTYEVKAVGTIAEDGTMSGDWTSNIGQSGIWHSTSGTAQKGNMWYTADGTEIGPEIWGSFATIQEVYNDPCADSHGVLYKSPSPVGFGYYK